MLFNSHVFIFVFLPTVLFGLFAINHRFGAASAKLWLILCSLFFYGWVGKVWTLLLIASALFNFFLAQLLTSKQDHLRKILLTSGVISNIGLLTYFKYRSEFVFGINIFFDQSFTLPEIILPLAISFFSFHQVAYLVDVYQQRIAAEKKLTNYLLFISFFPHLIAGPIIYYREIHPQFVNPNLFVPNRDNLKSGFYLFAIGLLKKTLLADNIGYWVDTGFGHSSQLNQSESIALTYLFGLQLYFDFSAYCDMALGLARMFNVSFPLNFNSPYKATNVQDFWQRWHITLGRFFKDYVYIPLGGNRLSFKRQQWNLLIVLVLSGLWHGSHWLFFLWGLWHGVGMVIFQYWRKTRIRLHRVIGQLLTVNFWVLSLVLFRSKTWDQAIEIYRSIFSWNASDWLLKKEHFITDSNNFHWLYVVPDTRDIWTTLLIGISLVVGYGICIFCPNASQLADKRIPEKTYWLTLGIAFWIGVLMLSEYAPFIYFQF